MKERFLVSVAPELHARMERIISSPSGKVYYPSRNAFINMALLKFIEELELEMEQK